jgi:hypothetical protein
MVVAETQSSSRKLRSCSERLGWRSFLSALASICRIRSRVTSNRLPMDEPDAVAVAAGPEPTAPAYGLGGQGSDWNWNLIGIKGGSAFEST